MSTGAVPLLSAALTDVDDLDYLVEIKEGPVAATLVQRAAEGKACTRAGAGVTLCLGPPLPVCAGSLPSLTSLSSLLCDCV